MKKLLLVLTTILLQSCSVIGIRTVEMLDYNVIEEEGNFDIREYQDYWVVRTEVEGEYEESTSEAFGRLFKYISGQNTEQIKISMTGPVMQQQKSQKIAMTGPVIQKEQENGWTMEFVLPAKFNQTVPPQPLNPQVSIEKVSGYRAAALRYSGNLSEKKVNQKKDALLALVMRRGLQPKGTPFSAGYDPPWTLPFLKRNEVIVAVE